MGRRKKQAGTQVKKINHEYGTNSTNFYFAILAFVRVVLLHGAKYVVRG
jgi:hypothetical protein